MGNPLSTLVAKLAFLPPAASYEVDWQELLWLRTKRGQRIPAVFVPWPGAKFTILFSHANAEDLGLIFGHLKTLSEVLQVNVMGYEYTGYGQSTGTPSEAACYDDIVAAFGWLIKEKNLLPSEVILFGRSIGSGPTVELASRAEVGGIILQSAFTSCIRVAYDLKHTVGDIFCNIKKLHKVKCPALIIHGTRDDVVTLQHGKALFSAGPNMYMYACVCMCACVYSHACMQGGAHICIRVICSYACRQAYVHVYLNVHACMHACMHMHAHACLSVCMYLSMNACIFVHPHARTRARMHTHARTIHRSKHAHTYPNVHTYRQGALQAMPSTASTVLGQGSLA